VEPLKVLEHHDQRRQPTARLQQLPQEIACAQADQQAVEPLQGPPRGFETEQIEQEADTFRGPEAEPIETFVELACGHCLNVARRQAERPTYDLDECAERRLLPVRRAVTDQDPYALPHDLPDEFMHKARLADAGLANDVEDPDVGADRVEAELQFLQFAVASDVGREPALNLGVKPRRPLSDGVKPIGLLRIGLAFDLMLAKAAGLDQPVNKALD